MTSFAYAWTTRGERRLPTGRTRASGVAQAIGESRGKWGLGTDDRGVDVVPQDGRDEVIDGGGRDGEIGGERRGARMPGAANNVRSSEKAEAASRRSAQQRACSRPPPPRPVLSPLLECVVNAWAARLAESTTSFTTAFASFI